MSVSNPHPTRRAAAAWAAGLAVLVLIAGFAVRHRASGRSPGGLLAGSADVDGLRRAVEHATSAEVRAAAVVDLARTTDRSVLPLLVVAIEDDDPLVSGRAVAAVQHLLGVRYPIEEWPLDRAGRRRIAAMARSDAAALAGPGRAWWEAHTLQGNHP